MKNTSKFREEYEELSKKFNEIFVDTKFDVFERKITSSSEEGLQSEKYIEVTYGRSGKAFRLQDSASGYFEVLYILAEIANRTDSILILDEPALHLHPTKITLLNRVLTETGSNQVIIITHSPKFLDQKILETNMGRQLIYIKRENNMSNAICPDVTFNRIKKHEFKGEAFFANCNILVEGPADHATLVAASELLGDLFTRYDIEVVNIGGKENFEKWFELLDSFNILWLAVADGDFKPKTQRKDKVIRLDGKLEDLFTKLGWRDKGKLTSNEAYDFVTKLEKSGKKKFFDTEIGDVISKSLSLIGEEPKEVLQACHEIFPIRN
jgi:predicted ATP-dependent endonuclease of OLD family